MNQAALKSAASWAALALVSVGCGSYGETQWEDEPTSAEPGEERPRLPGEPPPKQTLPDEEEWDLGETGSGSADPHGPLLPDVPFVAHSLYCGDNVRGLSEQCDSGKPNDFCTSRCRAKDALAVAPAPVTNAGGLADAPSALSVTGPALLNPALLNMDAQLAEVGGGRVLGEGPHPIAAGDTGFAVALVDREEGASVRLATFEADGDRRDVYELGDESSFSDVAQPVVAALPEGLFAVAWTGFDADDDELGVYLQLVHPDEGPMGAPIAANTTVVGAQQDPDIVWTGSELVVAWTDYSSLSTGPDIRYRTFNQNLEPTSTEAGLALSSAVEGSVSLAPFAGSWAAAWRTAESDGQERIDVATSAGIFSLPNLTAGPMGERPALVELDASHLLVVFTTGSDPGSTGTANTGRLQYGVIDTAGATSLTPSPLLPLVPPYSTDSSLSQGEPSLTRSGDAIYLAWGSGPVVASPLQEDVWLKTLSWDEAALSLDVSRPERFLQVSELHRPGDQRAPKLAASPVFPTGAVLAAWVDYGRNLVGSTGPDVVAQLRDTFEHCNEYAQQAAPPFSLGMPITPTGTATNPFPLCTVEQLEYLAQNPSHNDKHFALMADLDLTGFEDQLGTFTGSFDGNGHTLANYSFDNPSASNAGFFHTLQGDGTLDGTTDGVVKNLTFWNADVSGAAYTGVVVGQVVTSGSIENVHVIGGTVTSSGARFGGVAGNVLGRIADSSSSATVTGTGSASIAGGLVGEAGTGSTIERCSATGSVTGPTSEAGGLIGKSLGTITRSFASGAVTAQTQVGGLVGSNTGTVTDSYARGAVTAGTAGPGGSANGGRAGALIGQTEAGSTITRSYGSGAVAAATDAGGLTGYQNGTTTYSASVWNNTANAALGAVGNLGTAPTGTVAKSAADMKLRATYLALAWDFLNVWAIYEGVGDSGDFPIHLTRAYDFCGAVPQQNTPPFAIGLGADGTAAKPYPLCTVGQMQHWADTATAGTLRTKHFRLMGDIDLAGMTGTLSTQAFSFAGLFDGNGKTLRNFNRSSTGSEVGLFGGVQGTIRSLTLENLDVEGGTNTGGLAGFAWTTSVIEDVHLVSGQVAVTVPTALNVGGLVGYLGGRISGSTASAVVSSSGDQRVGGLIGYAHYNTTVERSSSTGSVIYTGTVGSVGGFVGQARGSLTACASSSTVYSTSANTGGLAGSVVDAATVTDCAATGTTSSTGAQTGGLIGQAYTTSALVTGSRASGSVSGTTNVGGLLGVLGGGRVEESTASATVACSGEFCGGLVGQTSPGARITASSSSGAVAGTSKVGGLLGGSAGGTLVWLTGCAAAGSVTGGAYLGGLVGYGPYLSVTDSWAEGNVTQSSSTSGAGGLIGYLAPTTSSVTRSYARGNVSIAANSVGGGLIGEAREATVSESYAAGAVMGTGTKGGLVGRFNVVSSVTCNSSFWNTTANSGLAAVSNASPTGAFGRTTTELQQQATYTAQGWDFTTVWTIDEGVGYAELR